jgi:hypothetical protein
MGKMAAKRSAKVALILPNFFLPTDDYQLPTAFRTPSGLKPS